MDKQILNFTVNEQILVCENPIKISTNKVNYIQAHFDLGTNWSGFDSVRAVWFNDFNCISTVLDSLGTCAVPFEVMKRKGCVKVNLVGSISEDDVLTDRLTSYPVVAVIVDCTAQITGANTSPITPSEFEQFAQRVHTDAERAEAGATASEQSAQNASDSATSASTSASNASISENNARASERNAEVYKNQAHEEAQDASESATSAQNYAEDAESARDTILGMRATANTLSEGSDATASYSNGLLTLGIPRGNTGAKGDKGDRGETGATPNLSIGTVTTLDPTEDATATISGTAENPILSFGIPKGDTGEVSLSELEDATVAQTLSDNTPYNYRRTNNGQGSGTREYDEIVGASVGWNQLIYNGNFESLEGWNVNASHSKSVSDNIITVTLNTNATNSTYLLSTLSRKGIANHVYIYDFYANPSRQTKMWLSYSAKFSNTKGHVCPASQWTECSRIIKSLADDTDFSLYVSDPATLLQGDTFSLKDYNIIDLTLFNSQIADYVYSLERSTAGSGVTWLKTHFPKLFDNGYQPFDSGSIKSVSGISAHKMTGANLLDTTVWVENHYISANGVIGSESGNHYSENFSPIKSGSYCISVPRNASHNLLLRLHGYNESKQWVKQIWTEVVGPGSSLYQTQVTIDDSVSFVRISSASLATDIQLEMGNTATDFEPYESHTYPLDSSVELRGQYKLDNGNLYAVGDVWSSDGTVTRKYGEAQITADLITMNTAQYSNVAFADIHVPTGGMQEYSKNAMLEKFGSAVTHSGTWDSASHIGRFYNDATKAGYWVGYPAGTTLEQMQADLVGLTMVYELATSTEESAEPYTSPQWCDSHGTEEYVGSELPVGHNTDYPMTMVDCADGLSNGTYTPKLTVTNGKLTFEWQSV